MLARPLLVALVLLGMAPLAHAASKACAEPGCYDHPSGYGNCYGSDYRYAEDRGIQQGSDAAGVRVDEQCAYWVDQPHQMRQLSFDAWASGAGSARLVWGSSDGACGIALSAQLLWLAPATQGLGCGSTQVPWIWQPTPLLAPLP